MPTFVELVMLLFASARGCLWVRQGGHWLGTVDYKVGVPGRSSAKEEDLRSRRRHESRVV